jgi:hypothetical protein
VGTTVRLKFWRFAAAEVPHDRDELIAWLYERWQELDDWVGEMRSGETPVEEMPAEEPARAGASELDDVPTPAQT